MNKIHRTVWSPALGAYVAAPETARARGKASSALRLGCGALTLALGVLSPGAWAAGGAGGAGDFNSGGAGGDIEIAGQSTAHNTGGAAGTEPGANGGDGITNPGGVFTAGAGGGGGASGSVASPTGGNGGNGSVSNPGGAGSYGGGGGGAGGHGYVATSATVNTLTATGGNGGNGSDGRAGVAGAGAGGGGGDAGTALVVTTAGVTVENTASGSLLGGNGGNGGAGNGIANAGGAVGNGGNGGNGAAGLSGAELVVVNAGTIAGGNGGTGGASSNATAGTNGVGGEGISGAISVVNSGAISGGLSGDGVTRANAITFSGTNNTLELQAGSTIMGNVVAVAGGTNAFVLGGAGTASFDVAGLGTQYQNFNSFSKTGTGIWALTGSNAAVTPWTVSAGTLSIASDASLGDVSGALTLNGGALQVSADIDTSRAVTLGAAGGTFSPDAGTTLTVSSVVSGDGSLAMSGAGTLALNNANTYTGGTTLNSGTLAVNNNQALGAGTLTINGGALNSNYVSLANDVVANGDFNASGYVQLTGNVQLNNTVRITLVGSSTLPHGTAYFNGAISGPGGITYDSALPIYGTGSTYNDVGQVVLSGSASNTYEGPTTVQGNVWLLLQRSGVGVPTDLTVSDNAVVLSVAPEQIGDTVRVTVNSQGQDVSLATPGATTALEGLTLATWATGTPITETIGSLYGNGTVGLGAGTLRVGAGEFSGVISDGSYTSWYASQSGSAAAGQLVKYGPDTLVLSGDNTYSGGTIIEAGTLQLGAGGTTGSILGDAANDGTLAFNRSNAYSFTGAISGAGAVQQLGSGTITLTGTNTYTGGTTVQAGALVAGSAGAFVQNTAYTVNGGTLDLGSWDLATSNFSGTGGTVALNAQTLTADQAADSSYAGAITGTGGVVKTGAGTLTLSGASSYSGGTALKEGQIKVSSNTALGTGELAMDDGTALGFAADGLTLTNAIRLTGSNDPVIDTGSFSETLAGVISGGGFITKQGSGTLTLSGANTYTGATTVAQGTLRAGAANAFSAASAVTVASGATLDTAGFNQTVAGLNNAGTVSLLGSGIASTLTVNGDYVGDNGLLQIGTVLGDSSSATDKLVVSGSASGTTAVQVTNLGGLGAQTTGDGIQIISAAGGIADGAFSLAEPVSAGAYDYHLNTTSDAAYLSSTNTTPGATVPTYRAEVPLYAALPEQFRQANLAMLGNVHQRTGDDGVTGANTTNPNQGLRQAWGRIISIDRDISQSGTVSPTSSGRLTGFQAGTDLWANANWRTGVYVGQLEGDMSVTGFARGLLNYAAGSNDLRSHYLGAYATWKNDSGFYANAVLQTGRHRYTVTPTLAFASSGKGDSLLASIEVSQAFNIAPNWTVEPQLQLVHQTLDLDNTRITGAWVNQKADGGWMARAGARVKGEFQTGMGTLQPYARFNVYKRSSGTDTTTFVGPAAATAITTNTGGTSSELAAGATWQLSQSISVYGEIGKLWAQSGGAQVRSGVNGSLGVKVRW